MHELELVLRLMLFFGTLAVLIGGVNLYLNWSDRRSHLDPGIGTQREDEK